MLLLKIGKKRHKADIVHATRINLDMVGGLSPIAKKYLRVHMDIVSLEGFAKMPKEKISSIHEKIIRDEVLTLWHNVQKKMTTVPNNSKKFTWGTWLSKDDRLTLKALYWFEPLFLKKDFKTILKKIVPKAFEVNHDSRKKKESLRRRIPSAYKIAS